MVYLKNELPRRIKIGRDRYRIKTDFKDWIKFSSVLLDEEIQSNVKSYILVDLICIDKVESVDNYQRAITALFSFYRMYKKEKNVKEVSTDIAYDYEEDWNLIYSAFIDQYNIDLYSKEMHWFEFKSLFDTLNKDTSFMKIVGYRTVDLSKIKDKEIRKEYAELKAHYSINRVKQSQKSAKDREGELIAQSKKGGGMDGS